MADPNRALFETVVSLLAPVLDELVFVGGCTTGIFVTDPAAGGIRPTRDVDAIVDVTSYAQYTALSDRLRTLSPRTLAVWRVISSGVLLAAAVLVASAFAAGRRNRFRIHAMTTAYGSVRSTSGLMTVTPP